MGIVPIAIGVIRLLQLRGQDKVSEQITKTKNREYLSFLTVGVVTFSNGGDNIGVYTPLFAKYNNVGDVSLLIGIFMSMTAVWCIIGYYLVNHRFVATRISRIGHVVLPFVLIGLGIYILANSFLV